MNRYIQYDARLKGDSPFLSAGYPPFLLDREGNWEEGPEPAGHVLVQFNMNGDVWEWVPPEYAYTLEDGWVTSVSFTDVAKMWRWPTSIRRRLNGLSFPSRGLVPGG